MTDRRSGVFYYGSSMLRTFTPGETLILESKPFDQLRCGDAVAVFNDIDGKPGIIHRIVAFDGSSAITMGDNNDQPDADKLTPDSRFMICTGAVSLDGRQRKIANGRMGMFKFRINRFRRFCRNIATPAVRRIIPLMFWRIKLAESGKFSDGSTVFSFGRYFIARRTASGIITYRNEIFKLFFRLPSQKGAVR